MHLVPGERNIMSGGKNRPVRDPDPCYALQKKSERERERDRENRRLWLRCYHRYVAVVPYP